jgi:transcriptional regulator with XRE-family HTH domain
MAATRLGDDARKARERERARLARQRKRERERLRSAKRRAKEREKQLAFQERASLRESKAAKRLLEKLLKREPSMAALARKMGLSPSTIRRWRKARITPPNAGIQLEMYQASRQVEKKARREELSTFQELMKLAGQEGKLPTVRGGAKPYIGPRVQGRQWTRAIQRELSESVINDLVSWAQGLPHVSAWRFWQFTLVSSQYALNSRTPFVPTTTGAPDVNYKTVEYVTQVPHAKSGDFAVGIPISTPRGKRSVLLAEMRATLNEILNRKELRVFIHAITAWNYRLRTEAERKTWESAKRRERFKKQKRREQRAR